MTASRPTTVALPSATARAGLVCLLGSVVSLAGCGWQEYEERMQASAGYFEYINRGHEVLGGGDEETVSEYGITIRVPKRFRVIAAQTTKDDDGQDVRIPGEQDRQLQQQFAGSPLPGLLGSWYAVLTDDKGKKRRGVSRMFLFGNYRRFEERNSGANVKPMELHVDLVNALAAALSVPPPAAAQYLFEKVPKTKKRGYVQEKYFTKIVIAANDADYRLFLYPAQRTESDDDGEAAPNEDHLQFAVLFVVPTTVSNPVSLDDGIQFCLEWMNVTGSPPDPLDAAGGGDAGGF